MGKDVGIIAIGNPGAGKSTILNSLAEEVLFKVWIKNLCFGFEFFLTHMSCIFQSGYSVGSGLTFQLDIRENKNGKFFDTPGLADEEKRKQAGKAISTALKQGGIYHLHFTFMQKSLNH